MEILYQNFLAFGWEDLVMIGIGIFTGAFTGLCAQFLINHGGKLWKTISQ